MELENLTEEDLEVQFIHYQSKLFPFAYNVVEDTMEAEDIVQETLNKYFLEARDHIEKPFSYLVKSVVNKAINQKKLLRNRMEIYPGEWLPVPILTEETVYSKVDTTKILNYSLLVLLEKLNARERAVFILKETFDFPHHEIADVLEITVENCRQLLKRAKQKLEALPRGSFTIKSDSSSILKALADAILKTDMETVKALLSSDIQATSDGGPKVSAARNILEGRERVSKFLKALWHKYYPGASMQYTAVNHKPALIFFHDNEIFPCMLFEIWDNKIEQLFTIVNPDKLQQLKFRL